MYMALIMTLEILITILVVYCICKLIRYVCKLCPLNRTQTGLNYLNPGERPEDFEIMYLPNLPDAPEEAKNHANGH